MTSVDAQRLWEAEFERLNDACKARCTEIDGDDEPNKFARQCKARVELIEATCPIAPPRILFELFEALQDMWEADGPLEALEVISLEMQLEAVDDEIDRRELRQEHKIFLRTRPRRRAAWVRSTDDS